MRKMLKEELSEKKFFIYTPEREIIYVKDYEYGKDEVDFKVLVNKEAFGITSSEKREPDAIPYLKRFGMDWESMSDIGHMRFQPDAALMLDLLSEYSEDLVKEIGIPIYLIKGTNMFRLDSQPVAEHAKLFGGRLYTLKIDEKEYVMRYAACHQQFAAMRDWQISYKNLPLGAFEVADSYRYEQSGELLLGFRTRKMTMPDLHILTKDIVEAERISLDVYKKIFDEWENKLGRNLVNLYNITPSFFLENKEYMDQLMTIENRPVLLKFIPENKYYWVINVENHIVDTINNPREIATFQIDIGNAKRFGITYLDEKGHKQYPPIIHTAILGTLERYLYSLFDTAALNAKKGKKPSIPTWLSPIQVRLIPTTNEYLEYCEELADKMVHENLRVDIDDRLKTVSKRIADAEKSWIPYIIVCGKKEKETNNFSIRKREEGSILNMSYEEMIDMIKKETNGKPFKFYSMPRRLSKKVLY